MRDRQLEILRIIIEDYMHSGNPIGSKYLLQNYHLPFSSATIRNEMATLETLGFLEKQHTSSGRIPSINGYRYYAKVFVPSAINDSKQIVEFDQMYERPQLFSEVVKDALNILAKMTKCSVIYLGSNVSQRRFSELKVIEINVAQALIILETDTHHVETALFPLIGGFTVSYLQTLVEFINHQLNNELLIKAAKVLDLEILPKLSATSDNYYFFHKVIVGIIEKLLLQKVEVSGISNIISYTNEFSSTEIVEIVQLLETKDKLIQMFGSQSLGNQILVGDEMQSSALSNCAVITNSFLTFDGVASIAVVGPIRINYPEIIQAIEYVSQQIANY